MVHSLAKHIFLQHFSSSFIQYQICYKSVKLSLKYYWNPGSSEKIRKIPEFFFQKSFLKSCFIFHIENSKIHNWLKFHWKIMFRSKIILKKPKKLKNAAFWKKGDFLHYFCHNFPTVWPIFDLKTDLGVKKCALSNYIRDMW